MRRRAFIGSAAALAAAFGPAMADMKVFDFPNPTGGTPVWALDSEEGNWYSMNNR